MRPDMQARSVSEIRYKKGRARYCVAMSDCGLCEHGSKMRISGGFAPRPPGFDALVPGRKSGTGRRGPFADPTFVPAPGTALRLLPSRALSSAQVRAIVTKAKGTTNQRGKASDAPLLGDCLENITDNRSTDQR